MSPARALQSALRLLLALVLGLGPLGPSLFAAGLHAPLCGCAGCGQEESTTGCCESPAREDPGPALTAEGACPCTLSPSSEEPSPALAPRLSEGRSQAQAQLERSQRAVALATTSAPLLEPRDSGTCASPPWDPSGRGLAGTHRPRGAARASALGALLL